MRRVPFLLLAILLAVTPAAAKTLQKKSVADDTHPVKTDSAKKGTEDDSHPAKKNDGTHAAKTLQKKSATDDAAKTDSAKTLVGDDSHPAKKNDGTHAAKRHQKKKEHSDEETLPDIQHERVDYWVAAFSKMHDYHKKIAAGFVRKAKYQGILEKELRKRGMPQSLIYLAFEESAFNPDAGSREKAVGIWQLTPATARLYGLKVNKKIDQRKDIEKETDAALGFLDHLHRRFGCWYLAAAAYDSGEHRIAHLMKKKFGREKGHDHDYYRIWDDLPGETRDYVPAIIALKRISKDPAKYGF